MRATRISDPVRCMPNRPTAHAAGTAITAESTVETTPTRSEFPIDRRICPASTMFLKFSRVGLNHSPTDGSVTCTLVLNAAANIHTSGSAKTSVTTPMVMPRSHDPAVRRRRRAAAGTGETVALMRSSFRPGGAAAPRRR